MRRRLRSWESVRDSRLHTARELALALSVGVVLADSSVVTLALPDILRDYDSTVVGVSWVLTSFNLALAILLLPAAGLARRSPRAGWAGGLALFTLASLSCAVAPALGVLIAGRVVQAGGGALTIACAVELLARSRGRHDAAASLWGAAGTAGIAIGPAVGGLLTDLLSWQAIFLAQLPLLLLLPLAARARLAVPEPGAAGAFDLRPELALALLSAGLTGALFLLVILLTEGWGLSPLAAGATVSTIPLAALGARYLLRHAGPQRSAALAGAIAVAGGLGALAVLPGASFALTLQPQVMIGAGLALALPVLTLAAVGGRDPRGTRAASSIAARHAGIVVGILVLAPVLANRLEVEREAAQSSSTALLLDAPLSPETKISLAQAIGNEIETSNGKLPKLAPAFGSVAPAAGTEASYEQLQDGMEDQVHRAATAAFSVPFLVAAMLALLAVLPTALLRGLDR